MGPKVDVSGCCGSLPAVLAVPPGGGTADGGPGARCPCGAAPEHLVASGVAFVVAICASIWAGLAGAASGPRTFDMHTFWSTNARFRAPAAFRGRRALLCRGRNLAHGFSVIGHFLLLCCLVYNMFFVELFVTQKRRF